jgi:predicted Fe-Mo cluster-binding NifX family protein
MILAIPDWEGRVSPVFDVARQLLVAHVVAGKSDACRHEPLSIQSPADLAQQLAQWGVNILICGGISSSLRETLEHAGITVVPQICGPVQDILRAYLEKQLPDKKFAMPGCCDQRPRCRARRKSGSKAKA